MSSKHGCILVVDDEPLIATTVTAILRMNGWNVRHFTAPLEALRAVQIESPDLLISDVIMPEMSGIHLAIKIKELCPSCKVLLFSGQAATTDLLEKAEANGNSFVILAKPVHPTLLLSTVQHILQAHEHGSEPALLDDRREGD